MKELQEAVSRARSDYPSWRAMSRALGVNHAILSKIAKGEWQRYSAEKINQVRLVMGLPSVGQAWGNYCYTCGSFHHIRDCGGNPVLVVDEEHKVIKRGKPGSSKRMSFRLSQEEARSIKRTLKVLGYETLREFVVDQLQKIEQGDDGHGIQGVVEK